MWRLAIAGAILAGFVMSFAGPSRPHCSLVYAVTGLGRADAAVCVQAWRQPPSA